MNLTNLIGNEPLKRSLDGQTRPPHAVIISGAKGSGRHTLAMLLKQAYLCTGENAPCGVCPNCRKIRNGIHPDVIDINSFCPESEWEKEVKVDNIRDLRRDAQIAPNQSERKVYFVDRPMNLNAQNAMLKLLEEGPTYAAFILLTENSSGYLETVRSRCTSFRLSPVTEGEAMLWLTRHYPDISRDRLYEAAQSCGGLLGQAVEALEQRKTAEDAAPYVEGWVKALLERREWALMECAAAVQTKKPSRDTIQRVYEGLGHCFRDALLCSAGLPPQTPTAERLAAVYTTQELLKLYALTEEARDMGKFNVSPAHSSGWLAVKFNL